jgi:hypothetical protein
VTNPSSAPYQHPHLRPYFTTATVLAPAPAPAIHQPNSSSPATNYVYDPQYYSAPVNSWPHGGAGLHPWTMQKPYGWPGFLNSWQEQPRSNDTYQGSGWEYTGSVAATCFGRKNNRHFTRASRLGSSRGRDSYRPACADISPRDEYFITSAHQLPRRTLVSDSRGPRDNRSWGQSTAMKPVPAYPLQLEQYEKQYPKVTTLPESSTVAWSAIPFIPRHVSGTLPSSTIEYISRQSLKDISHGDQDTDVTKNKFIQHQTRYDFVARKLGSSPRPRQSCEDVSEDVPQIALGHAVISGQQVSAFPHMSESQARRLKEPDMQITMQTELMKFYNSSAERVAEIAEPFPVQAIIEPEFAVAVAEDVERAQAGHDIKLTPAPMAGSLESDHSNENLESTAADIVANVTKAIKTHNGGVPALETLINLAQSGLKDDIRLAPQGATGELTKAFHASTDVKAVPVAVVVNPGQRVPDEVIETMTDAAEIASSAGPRATNAVERATQKKRRNGQQKKGIKQKSVKVVNTRPSALALSRDRDGNVSQHYHSTTESSITSPPSKRMKEQSNSLPFTGHDDGRASFPIANGWGNFLARIKQDDDNMKMKLKDEHERQGGDAFRPEIRETYKDQKGKAQMRVHGKVNGRVVAKKEESDEEEDVGGVQVEPEMTPGMVME